MKQPDKIKFSGVFRDMYSFMEQWNLIVHDFSGHTIGGRGIRHLAGGVNANIKTLATVTKLKIPVCRDASYPIESAFIEDVAYHLKYGPVTIKAVAFRTFRTRQDNP